MLEKWGTRICVLFPCHFTEYFLSECGVLVAVLLKVGFFTFCQPAIRFIVGMPLLFKNEQTPENLNKKDELINWPGRIFCQRLFTVVHKAHTLGPWQNALGVFENGRIIFVHFYCFPVGFICRTCPSRHTCISPLLANIVIAGQLGTLLQQAMACNNGSQWME